MALESGTYIDSLDAANPATTDGLSQADDHMRLIKATIKATFPNLTGAVTLTQSEINALETRVDDLEGTGQYSPAIVTSNGYPALKTGITQAEVRSLLGLSASGSVAFGSVNAGSNLTATTVSTPTINAVNEINFGTWTIREYIDPNNSLAPRKLQFLYGNPTQSVVFELTSVGHLTVADDITAFGSL